MTKRSQVEPNAVAPQLVRRHLQLGWSAILVFLALGLALEALHGFKAGLYLDVANETRRLMWTLGHAHGALLGVLQVAFALTVRASAAEERAWARRAGLCLSGATVLMPAGFLLGGAVIHGGDPGAGILLVPAGGVLLFAAVLLTARNAGRPG